jgi:stage V sporulation protein S
MFATRAEFDNEANAVKTEILKVSANSRPSAVAGAIAGVVRESGYVEMQAIGASAVNQAVKAIAIARGYLAPGGIEIVCLPAFTDVTIGNEERTAVRLVIESRPISGERD